MALPFQTHSSGYPTVPGRSHHRAKLLECQIDLILLPCFRSKTFPLAGAVEVVISCCAAVLSNRSTDDDLPPVSGRRLTDDIGDLLIDLLVRPHLARRLPVCGNAPSNSHMPNNVSWRIATPKPELQALEVSLRTVNLPQQRTRRTSLTATPNKEAFPLSASRAPVPKDRGGRLIFSRPPNFGSLEASLAARYSGLSRSDPGISGFITSSQ